MTAQSFFLKMIEFCADVDEDDILDLDFDSSSLSWIRDLLRV